MKNIMTAVGFGALVLAGCADQSGTATDINGSTQPGQGDVDFNLALPDGSTLDAATLDISCPGAGISQSHSLDLTNGNVVAAFGALPVGSCDVSITGTNSAGATCTGSANFAVVDGQVLDVQVAVTCPGQAGTNNDPNGGAKVTGVFDSTTFDCSADRILKMYAIPSNLTVGSSVNVELESSNVAGTAAVAFAATNGGDPANTGALNVTDNDGAGCGAASEDCATVTCTAVGKVWVEATLTDDECSDTEAVWIDCLPSTTPVVCGDGVLGAGEQCDDGNTVAGDGCDANCQNECGNGVLDGAEICDGQAGLQAGQVCAADCTIVPTCGNGIMEGAEACDDGNLTDGDGCSSTCSIEAGPVCGDGVLEGTEQCDDGNTVDGDGCSSTCVTEVAANVCKDCLTDPNGVLLSSPLAGQVTACVADTGACNRALNCLTESFCANGNTVSECYCGLGADPNTCINGSVPPTGACQALIEELAGPGLQPSDYVAYITSNTNQFGAAWSLFNVVSGNPAAGCTGVCATAPVDPTTVGPF